ncbi:MAG TPA: formate hydrogenlyase [Patescibacteria group bacterium]
MKLLQLLRILLLGPRVTEKVEIPKTPEDAEFEKVGEEVKEIVKNLYGGRSLRIRAVDAGSTNGEEIELTALNNAYYDIDRFGLSFVASPRHADMLFVSGPVTRNLERALKTTYEAAPQPCIVVALGDGAIDGGIWKDSYAVVGGVEKVIPVHVKVAGDPPRPVEILRGVLSALRSQENN